MGLVQKLVAPTLREGDTAEELAVKGTIVPAYVFGSIITTLTTILRFARGPEVNAYNVPIVLLMVVTSGSLAYVYTTGTFSKHLAEVTLMCCALGVLVVDWYQAAALTQRVWPIVVIIMDVLLAISASRFSQLGVMHATFLWLCVDMLETSIRLGLYDLPHWTDVESSTFTRQVDCANPPCAMPWTFSVVVMLVQALVLFVDYIATRGFAEGQHRERERVLAAVHVAERVAFCLARFDLESAEEALLDGGSRELPEDLSLSFERLLWNLARYRPYLPASVFADDSEQEPQQPEERSLKTASGRGWVDNSQGSENRQPSAQSGELTMTMGRSVCRAPSASDDLHGRIATATSLHSVESSAADVARLPSTLSDAKGVSRMASVALLQRNWHQPAQKRVTLLVSNRRNFLSTAPRVEGLLGSWIEQEVEYFSSVVSTLHGIVDLLSADHFSASFGAAVRLLGAHRSAAVRCAARLRDRPPSATPKQHNALVELAQSTAVCSGSALCGDYGSSRAQRYMIIGVVNSTVHAVERAATVWHISILADETVQSDAANDWECRLRATALFGRRGRERPVVLWEIMRERPRNTDGPEEWMYELAAAQPDPWNGYNTAVRFWCSGSTARALEMIDKAAEAESPDSVLTQTALAALRSSISSGAAPPIVRLAVTQRAAVAPSSAPQTPLMQDTSSCVLMDESEHRSGATEQQPARRERSVVFTSSTPSQTQMLEEADSEDIDRA